MAALESKTVKLSVQKHPIKNSKNLYSESIPRESKTAVAQQMDRFLQTRVTHKFTD